MGQAGMPVLRNSLGHVRFNNSIKRTLPGYYDNSSQCVVMLREGNEAVKVCPIGAHLELIWSAVTCYRFGRPRPVAAVSDGKGGH